LPPSIRGSSLLEAGGCSSGAAARGEAAPCCPEWSMRRVSARSAASRCSSGESARWLCFAASWCNSAAVPSAFSAARLCGAPAPSPRDTRCADERGAGDGERDPAPGGGVRAADGARARALAALASAAEERCWTARNGHLCTPSLRHADLSAVAEMPSEAAAWCNGIEKSFVSVASSSTTGVVDVRSRCPALRRGMILFTPWMLASDATDAARDATEAEGFAPAGGDDDASEGYSAGEALAGDREPPEPPSAGPSLACRVPLPAAGAGAASVGAARSVGQRQGLAAVSSERGGREGEVREESCGDEGDVAVAVSDAE